MLVQFVCESVSGVAVGGLGAIFGTTAVWGGGVSDWFRLREKVDWGKKSLVYKILTRRRQQAA